MRERCFALRFHSSQKDVTDFLRHMNLNPEHYQIEHHNIFLRESEKAKLDHRLHHTILASIVTIQRWFRTCIERRNFLSLRNAAIRSQVHLTLEHVLTWLTHAHADLV